MIKTQKVVREVQEVIDVLCNKCGETCKDEMNFNGLIEARIEGAYDSKYLEDTTRYKFSLCEKCLKELFDTFKISPIENCFGGGECSGCIEKCGKKE